MKQAPSQSSVRSMIFSIILGSILVPATTLAIPLYLTMRVGG